LDTTLETNSGEVDMSSGTEIEGIVLDLITLIVLESKGSISITTSAEDELTPSDEGFKVPEERRKRERKRQEEDNKE
jgi:hypothetical protein